MNLRTTVTIARQYGSGGREIGRRLAEMLGARFLDRELIALAAKESGMSEKVFEKADEKASNSLLYALMMGNYSMLNGIPVLNEMPLNDKLFLLQSKIIRRAAKSGPCVIVGRCADSILQEDPNAFRVFLYADEKYRRERIVKEYGVEPGAAPGMLSRQDKQRAEYYSFYTNRKWADMQNYDLMADSSALGIEGTAKLIAEAVRIWNEKNSVQIRHRIE